MTPDTLARLQAARAAGTPVPNLNELEYVKGEIFANIWQTDYIARIDPGSGKVTGWVDLRGLLPPRDRARADAVYAGVREPLVAEDVADCVAWMLTRPRHVNVDLLVVRPLAQAAQHKVVREQQ